MAIVEHPACAPEGATEPVDYSTGARAQADDQLFRRVLIAVAIVCASIVAYVLPQGPAS